MPSRPPRRLSLAGVGALVVLNVVLVGLLLTRPTPPPVEEPDVSASSAAREGEAEETSAPRTKTSPEPLPTPTVRVEPARRLLADADERVAWRATVGDCESQGSLEHTTDGGETWEELPLELAPIGRIRVLGVQRLFVIGGAGDCEPTYRASASGGASWTTSDEYLVGSWYLHPDDGDAMSAPVGEVDTPCGVAGLAGLDAAHAAVLCTDGSLRLTDDGGAGWRESAPPVEAAAVGVADEGYVLAGATDTCGDAVAVVLTDVTGAPVTAPSCLDPAAEAAGDLAVSARGTGVWLWAGDEVSVLDVA